MDTDNHTDSDIIRRPAISLFTFLRELTELRSKIVRTLDQYEKTLWFSDIPKEIGCYCIANNPPISDDDIADVWLEIKKPKIKAPPEIPDVLKPWIELKQVQESNREYPDLKEKIICKVLRKDEFGREEEHDEIKELNASPDIKIIWEEYVEKKWWPWAEDDRKLQLIQKIYTDLFSLYQKQQKLGEAYEVILGLGCLVWKTSSGAEIKRHIVVAQTSLTFDATRGIMTLKPAGDGAKPTLEQDMLEPQDRPDVTEQKAIEKEISEVGDNLWDGVRIQSVLRAWVHSVSSRGIFDTSLTRPTKAEDDPKIYLAPALILRKRTERSIRRVFEEIIAQLKAGVEIPIGVKRLVTIMDDKGLIENESIDPNNGGQLNIEADDIYFPLLANEAQLEIVKNLSNRQGVLVQGPPGTGKSHTIANLVCHLLAKGQRVLVTSQAARALKVLKNKFPKNISDLCVILLGDDLSSMQALEDSVRGITDRYNKWDKDENQKQVDELKKKLDEARRTVAKLNAELISLREAETYKHPKKFGVYEGTLQNISVCLKNEENRYSWAINAGSCNCQQKHQYEKASYLGQMIRICNVCKRPLPYEIRIDEEDPPLSVIEFKQLLEFCRTIDKEKERDVGKLDLEPNELPPPEKFHDLVTSEQQATVHFNETSAQRITLNYTLLKETDSHHSESLLQVLTDIIKKYESLIRHIQPWTKKAAHQILADRDRSWLELLNLTEDHLSEIEKMSEYQSDHDVTGLGQRPLNVVKAQASALLNHLVKGGSLGFGPFRARVVKEALYIIKEVRIDGNLCNNIKTIKELIEHLEVKRRFEIIDSNWSKHISPPEGSNIFRIAEYRDLCEPLILALELHNHVRDAKIIASNIKGFIEPTWHDIESLKNLVEIIKSISIENNLIETRKALKDIENIIVKHVKYDKSHHTVVQDLKGAVENRSYPDYCASFQLLNDLCATTQNINIRNELISRLRLKMPYLANEFLSTYSDSIWSERIANLSNAWNWAQADTWVKRLSDPKAQERTSYLLENARTQIRELICELAATKAWGHCFSRLTEHERQHLMAWTQAMRKIGKGTGKHANLHRKAAREHMEQCRSAIPAWIMPLYRVAETIRPGVDSFDVVIVDEASQCGYDALFLQYLGKKIVVVGDDKQISPSYIGIKVEDVELLRQRHIADLPLSRSIGSLDSFFSQAEVRYGGRIRLREHFRCMPEIIQFSNDLCYPTEPLIPLKQYGAGRLTPVVQAVHVPEGYQKGSSPRIVNPPEAEAIVNQIKQACENICYNKKTLGVISLLGSDQASLIESLLISAIGPEEMERRNIVCGDAYDFQGDERDVIFLSLVSAPTDGQRIGTLASEEHKRRFNVAASRAKDQMWLFHSATLNDLSPTCLRYQLLQYFKNPKVEPVEDGHVKSLYNTLASSRQDRSNVKPPQPFGSWFEVDVFKKIIERGYRVLPQYELSGYYIDFIVEGLKGRLAVECDGDSWHGADRYEYDMGRQRILERCGMPFWRIRGSTFYRDPDKSLEDLWVTLKNHQIFSSVEAGRATADLDSQISTYSLSVSSTSYQDNLNFDGETTENKVNKLQSSIPQLPSGVSLSVERLKDAGKKKGFLTFDEINNALPNVPMSNAQLDHILAIFDDLGVKIVESKEGDTLPTPATSKDETNVAIKPYEQWTLHSLPDPRTTAIKDIVPGLVEIISIEGPMPCHLAYRRYAQAAGISRIGGLIRSSFNKAAFKAVTLGLIDERNEHETKDQINKIVRKKGTPEVLLRSVGGRTFYEVPPSEIVALMNYIYSKETAITDEGLFRKVLEHYNVVRMTTNIQNVLIKAKSKLSSIK